jgi:hypothetical protein
MPADAKLIAVSTNVGPWLFRHLPHVRGCWVVDLVLGKQ